MKLSVAGVHRFDLPLRRPHRAATGTITTRIGFLLELIDEEGRRGWGEAAPLDRRDLDKVEAELARVAGHPDAIGDEKPVRTTSAVVAAAVDTARLDLRGQREGVSLALLLSNDTRSEIAVNALVSAAGVDEVADEVRAAVAAGFGSIKLKMAAGHPDTDVARVAAAREAAGPDVGLRLDANRGWDVATAIAVLGRAARLDIDYVEEPVSSPSDFAVIRRRTGVAVAADESLADPADLDRLLSSTAIDVAVLKPSLVGGPTVAVDLAHRCADAGVDVVVSSALDAAVGLTAAVHVAAAVTHRGAAGLATSSLLVADVAAPPSASGGVIVVPTGPGLGLGDLQP